MATVVFRGSRADVSRVMRTVGSILSGKSGDPYGIGKGFLTALGFGALTDIKQAYIEKARGGTDELGIKWPPLAPSTIANRRVGPGDLRRDQTTRDRERIRKAETTKAFARFQLSGLTDAEATRRAKIVGGLKATRQTGKTKLETLGQRQVEILRDTGVLFNSLSPGLLVDSGSGSLKYDKPTTDGGDEQIFELGPGEIIVGTTVEYASTHQEGYAPRNIPARPFLPPDGQVPDIWWQRWLGIANKALAASVRVWLERGGR